MGLTYQKVYEPISVVMPIIERAKFKIIFGIIFGSAEVRDETILPVAAPVIDFLLASNNLADCAPGFRGKLFTGYERVSGHVDFVKRPGRFVVR